MTDKNDTNGAAAEMPPAPEKMIINAQYLKDFSFENPNVLEFLAGQEEPPQLGVNIEVQANGVGPHAYEVVLQLTAEAKQKEKSVMVTEISYAGIFSMPEMDQDELRKYLLIECPKLLFPFARSISSNMTSESGLPPIMLEPVDFEALFKNQAETAA